MDLGCRRNECIHCPNRPSERFAVIDDPPPSVCRSSVDGQYPLVESKQQFVLNPFFETLAPPAHGEAFDAVSQLGECDDADENSIFVRLGQPRDNPGIRAGFGPFRYEIRVE